MKVLAGTIFVVTLAITGCASQKLTGAGATTPVAVQQSNSGWYLMQAPMRLAAAPNTSAQLYDWQEIAYFERASECDAARQIGITAYPADLTNMSERAGNSIEVSRQLAVSSLCVAAKDPRLDRWPVLAKLTSKF
jgi:hypothetical protein